MNYSQDLNEINKEEIKFTRDDIFDDISEIKNGSTVIANIDGDIYIKKIEKVPFENKIILKSNNSSYKDLEIDLNEHKNVKIVAIVRGKFRAV